MEILRSSPLSFERGKFDCSSCQLPQLAAVQIYPFYNPGVALFCSAFFNLLMRGLFADACGICPNVWVAPGRGREAATVGALS